MHTYEEMEKLIEELMSKYDDGRAFAGGVSEENIKRMEEILDVKLPEQYKWFLRKYGHGGFMGFEIFGFISNDSMPMVEYTQSYREKFKLGKEYIFIVNVDEYYYCLSCKT
ncbi:MAG: SMI1/KNR4 family protein [Endomicrobium sp.]|jgi:hypothetical protein|nr:SMI1/KNR4 family protein [Endomicrobium sp.]